MSGAAKLVMTSSSPVLTSVTVDVRMSSDNEVRKKRSAGRAASLGDAMEAAMADIFIVAFARRGGNEAGRKNNAQRRAEAKDRKSTRLNSSHTVISYAVFCLKKKK